MATRKVRVQFTRLSTEASAWDINYDIPAEFIASFQEQTSDP
jgi:hypothetical protein